MTGGSSKRPTRGRRAVTTEWGRRGASPVLPPWTDEAIGEVGQRVHDDDADREDDHQALQQGVVARIQRAEDQLAEAGPVENDLGQYRIADQRAEIQADDRDDWNEPVAQRMP